MNKNNNNSGWMKCHFNKSFLLIVIITGLCLSKNTLSEINIQKIKTNIVSQDKQVFDTSMVFDTKNMKKALMDWSIGYYMPRTFNQLVSLSGTDINPDLKMNIIDTESNHTQELIYVKKGGGYIYGDGYTNVLKPKYPFALKPNHKYRIDLINNNQWAPENINSMPQSFFIVNNASGQIITVNAPLNAYQSKNGFKNIGDYNQTETNKLINEHVLQNWHHSQSLLQGNYINSLGIIPSPARIISFNQSETLNLSGQFSFHSDFNDSFNKNFITKQLNLDIIEGANSFKKLIIKKVSKSIMSHPEGYRLTVSLGKIFIQAQTRTGVFYALQTLHQLAYLHHREIPILTVEDFPQMKYRGLLIDVTRHYFSLDDLQKIIKVMASIKLNTLHLHFADDEAWRLELPSVSGDIIKKASSRGFFKGSSNPPAMLLQANQDVTNRVNFNPNKKLINKSFPNATTQYGLFYSINDIKELIRYANNYHITIIPEVDFPGHARALVQTMPDIFINQLDRSQYISVQGYYDDVIPVCLYNKKTQQARMFTEKMNQIIQQINNLFSHQHTIYAQNEVSVGGDEVSKDAWSSDDSCSNNLTALDRSHKFFTELHENNPNIKLSGWQQYVQTDHGAIGNYALAPKNTGHTWVWDSSDLGIQHAQILAKANYPTVLAYSDHLYFDLTYTPDAWEPGLYWAGNYLDTQAALTSALAAKQTIESLQAKYQKNILGLEGTLWSENITNSRHLEYKMLPKVTGLAEAAWSPFKTTTENGRANWKSLAKRLGVNNKYDILGYLNHSFGVVYRGIPYGIKMEIPQNSNFYEE